MMNQVLVLGGRGHIGRGVVSDLITHTPAQITITGRTAQAARDLKGYPTERVQFTVLDLADQAGVERAIAASHLVIHCAGPFRYRDDFVLKTCIEQGVHYLDVSDDRNFTRTALGYQNAAQAAGVTAIVNTGVFPGISNSMARQGVEQLDVPEAIHLRYGVAGSGGAGDAVMQTTFLTIQHPFKVWLEGQWQEVKPYTGRELVEFPHPFGRVGVYWFDMPESFTLAETFPVQTVTLKFGTLPDLYNHLTWMVANSFPTAIIRQPGVIQVLSQVSRVMTRISDRFSGTGVALRVEVKGQKAGKLAHYCATFTHPDAATATGMGTGCIAQYILSGELNQPGVWTVEQAYPTSLFEQALQIRGVSIHQCWLQV
ncbi:saccharopine dehydrogenase NADP-binding domain-containing protein [Leptothermofonsia sichuanensis E412]|uniref:saccharopine dehydrogenase family protein n=1 Tax=Leptothermofonsia sichuanensis TaxID=2917832 RepID=UPI001CA688AC|nr:saccharopine dehydrogenase NADP-binding domain-containing protein [Leptothermofonsia sichuanensis]QZZ19356.1 saccharopine dehydrogenase NADP-binding domain-containing protein [Leptothermofonsia sichuanensis E412]